MAFSRSGFILYVDAYPACVAFYDDTLGLPVLFDTPDLTCFALGDSYLMVERDDRGNGSARTPDQPTCLRMNVSDVRAQADVLTGRGVEVEYQEHEWRTVAKFLDPAGSLCALKDDARFEQQIRDHRAALSALRRGGQGEERGEEDRAAEEHGKREFRNAFQALAGQRVFDPAAVVRPRLRRGA